jgi:cytochrome c oxidase cbb3-type subunit I
LSDKVRRDEIWVIWENDVAAGFIFARQDGALLRVDVQLLRAYIAAAVAVAVVTAADLCRSFWSKPMNLYFLMTALYVVMAIIAALDASLTSFGFLPWFNGLRWLRVHLITLGAMTEAIFGVLPLLVALRYNRPQPAFRWDIWLSLNAGLMTLLIGIPIVNHAFILIGGSLIFIAASLLGAQLWSMRPTEPAKRHPHPANRGGRRFYLAGLGFFLLGILIGTGLWLGWSEWLRIQIPLEAHIHANSWGLMSLVFAGLIVDTYPVWVGRPLAWPQSITPIFWLMVFGALGLVLGPWLQSLYFTVPGLIMHQAATLLLILNMIRPLWNQREAWATPGIWHVITAYFWVSAPVMAGPLILLGIRGIPGPTIEANAPQALIYGWVFQFGFALLPFFFRQAFLPGETPRVGGNWLSVVAANLGGVFLWASIFIEPRYGLFHGLAYALWAIAAVPIAVELWRIVARGLARIEDATEPVAGDAGD